MNIYKHFQFVPFICTFASFLLSDSNCEAGAWITIKNLPTDSVHAPLLLTDGMRFAKV